MGGAQSVGSKLFNRFDIAADVILGYRPAFAFPVLMIVDSADKTFFAVEIKTVRSELRLPEAERLHDRIARGDLKALGIDDRRFRTPQFEILHRELAHFAGATQHLDLGAHLPGVGIGEKPHSACAVGDGVDAYHRRLNELHAAVKTAVHVEVGVYRRGDIVA